MGYRGSALRFRAGEVGIASSSYVQLVFVFIVSSSDGGCDCGVGKRGVCCTDVEVDFENLLISSEMTLEGLSVLFFEIEEAEEGCFRLRLTLATNSDP